MISNLSKKVKILSRRKAKKLLILIKRSTKVRRKTKR